MGGGNARETGGTGGGNDREITGRCGSASGSLVIGIDRDGRGAILVIASGGTGLVCASDVARAGIGLDGRGAIVVAGSGSRSTSSGARAMYMPSRAGLSVGTVIHSTTRVAALCAHGGREGSSNRCCSQSSDPGRTRGTRPPAGALYPRQRDAVINFLLTVRLCARRVNTNAHEV
jgi:hypothetical protein